MSSGNLRQAHTDLEAAERQTPDSPQVCLALTELYARSGEENRRAASAQHCIALAHRLDGWEKQATLRSYLGKVYLANAEWQEALVHDREAIRLDPYEESYRFDFAQVLLGHERFAEAAAALEEACRTFDKSAQLELALGVAYYGQRRFPEAITAFLRTMDLAPDVVQPYVFVGRMLDQAGERLPEIVERYRAFDQANPTSYLGGLLLAKALGANSQSSNDQEVLLRRSIALNDANWENHYELGVRLEMRRDFAAAAQEFEKSIQRNSGIAASHYHLARVYDRLGRPDAAAREWEEHRKLTARDKITAGMEVTR